MVERETHTGGIAQRNKEEGLYLAFRVKHKGGNVAYKNEHRGGCVAYKHRGEDKRTQSRGQREKQSRGGDGVRP